MPLRTRNRVPWTVYNSEDVVFFYAFATILIAEITHGRRTTARIFSSFIERINLQLYAEPVIDRQAQFLYFVCLRLQHLSSCHRSRTEWILSRQSVLSMIEPLWNTIAFSSNFIGHPTYRTKSNVACPRALSTHGSPSLPSIRQRVQSFSTCTESVIPASCMRSTANATE